MPPPAGRRTPARADGDGTARASVALRSLAALAQDMCSSVPSDAEELPIHYLRLAGEVEAECTAVCAAGQLPGAALEELLGVLAQAGASSPGQAPSAAAAVMMLDSYQKMILSSSPMAKTQVTTIPPQRPPPPRPCVHWGELSPCQGPRSLPALLFPAAGAPQIRLLSAYLPIPCVLAASRSSCRAAPWTACSHAPR